MTDRDSSNNPYDILKQVFPDGSDQAKFLDQLGNGPFVALDKPLPETSRNRIYQHARAWYILNHEQAESEDKKNPGVDTVSREDDIWKSTESHIIGDGKEVPQAKRVINLLATAVNANRQNRYRYTPWEARARALRDEACVIFEEASGISLSKFEQFKATMGTFANSFDKYRYLNCLWTIRVTYDDIMRNPSRMRAEGMLEQSGIRIPHNSPIDLVLKGGLYIARGQDGIQEESTKEKQQVTSVLKQGATRETVDLNPRYPLEDINLAFETLTGQSLVAQY